MEASMRKPAIDRLVEKIEDCDNPSVVGLDTDFSYLPDNMRAKADTAAAMAEQILTFNQKIIDNIYDIVPAVKVQIAYYEKLGYEGLKAFADTLVYAAEKGMIVISDCKRNDIGSTMEAYSTAFLGKTEIGGKEFTAFPSDFMTVNAYLGEDGITPLVKDCTEYGKGIFALVKTSNMGSAELQDIVCADGKRVFEHVADSVTRYGQTLMGKCGYSSVGAVVGATHPEQGAQLRKQYPKLFFLVPGYGAQGGGADGVAGCFDARGGGAIVNNSRGILLAYRKDYSMEKYYIAARLKCIDMRDDIAAALKRAGKAR